MKLSYEVKVNIYVMRKPGVTWLQIYDQVDVKVTYSVKSYLPGYAEVYVRPEVVNLESVNFDSLTDKFIQENHGAFSSYDDLYKAAEKFSLEQLSSVISNTNLSANSFMSDKEGFLLTITQNKEGKWVIDKNDYDYDELVNTFTGCGLTY